MALHRNQREALLYLLPAVATRGLGFLLLPVYSRVLSPEEFGLVSLALVAQGMVRLAILPGMEAVYIRFGYRSVGSSEAAPDEHLGTIAWIHLGLLFFAIPISLLPARLILQTFAPELPFSYFLVAIAALVAGSLQAPMIARLMVERDTGSLAVREAASGLIAATLTLAGLLIFRAGPISILLADLAAGILVLPFCLRELLSALLRSGWRRESLATVSKAFGVAGPEALMQWMLTSADRFILNRFHGPAVTGIYVSGYQFGSIIVSLQIIGSRQWKAALLQRYASDPASDPPQAGLLYRSALRLFLALAGLVSVLAPFLASTVLGLRFASARDLIPVAAVIALLRIPMIFFSIHCWARGLRKLQLKTYVAALALFLAALLILVPLFGAQGAVWSGALALFPFAAVLQWRPVQELRLHPGVPSPAVAVSLASLIAGLAGLSQPLAIAVLSGLSIWTLITQLRSYAATLKTL